MLVAIIPCLYNLLFKRVIRKKISNFPEPGQNETEAQKQRKFEIGPFLPFLVFLLHFPDFIFQIFTVSHLLPLVCKQTRVQRLPLAQWLLLFTLPEQIGDLFFKPPLLLGRWLDLGRIQVLCLQLNYISGPPFGLGLILHYYYSLLLSN